MKRNSLLTTSFLSFLLALLCSCSSIQLPSFSAKQQIAFRESGSIILSRPMPSAEGLSFAKAISPDTGTIERQRVMAPLLGYFPPTKDYLPAVNESWLEVDRKNSTITLYEGKNAVRKVNAEGQVTIHSGDYFLLHKDKQPKWYASDEYFHARGLSVPPELDATRYLRGALGPVALYPVAGFPIHSSPLWSKDVGGLRVLPSELTPLFDSLEVGARIVVR